MINLNEKDLLRLSDFNLVDFWCQSSRWLPESETVFQNDSVFINHHLTFPACSFAFNLSMEETVVPEEFLSRAKDFFSGRKKAFSLILREHADRKIIEHCISGKIYLASETPAMVLDKPVDSPRKPDGAEMRLIKDARGVSDFSQIVSEAYEDLAFPPDVSSKNFMYPERVLEPQFIPAVIYYHGEPACAAMVFLNHGLGGIYWVGTLKKFRGMGFARYCVSEMGRIAFDLGAGKLVLQASRFGKPLYETMGYREFTRHPWFICSV